jgi:hypothetical protein
MWQKTVVTPGEPTSAMDARRAPGRAGRCRRREHAANGVEDHVRAARGEFPDAVGSAFAIGDWFGTEVAYVVVVLRGDGADDACPASSRDLYGEGAHPAGRPVHEQDLARPNVEDVGDGLVSGQPGQREAGRLGEAQGARLADEVARLGGDQFGQTAVGALHVAPYAPDDLISRDELGGGKAGPLHLACDVPARYDREVRVDGAVQRPGLHCQVGGVQRGGPHPHQHRVDVGLWRRQLRKLEDLGAAVLPVDHGPHRAAGTAIGMSISTLCLTIFHSPSTRRRSVS